MKMIKRYAGILMMLTLLVGFTSCESEEETEFNRKRLRDSILSPFFHSYIFAMYKNEALWI